MRRLAWPILLLMFAILFKLASAVAVAHFDFTGAWFGLAGESISSGLCIGHCIFR